MATILGVSLQERLVHALSASSASALWTRVEIERIAHEVAIVLESERTVPEPQPKPRRGSR